MALESPYEQCRRIIRSLITKHQWRLLIEEEFTNRVYARSRAENVSGEQAILAIAINEYCQVWYAACMSDAGQREQAFAEVWRYLYNVVFNKYKNDEVAQEISQRALILVWEKLDTCHNPGAFLRFCLYKILNAETIHQREQAREYNQTAIDSNEESNEEESGPLNKVQAPSNPAQEIDCTERYAELLQSFATVYTRSPRAKRQLDVVFYTAFAGLNSEEIAEKLEIGPSKVHELRSRGVKLLRQSLDFSSKLHDLVSNCL